MLTGAGTVHLPARPITLLVELDGPGGPIELMVTPDVQVVRPRPGMLVIPSVEIPLCVSARPAGGGAFPAPTVLHVIALGPDAQSADQDRVVLPTVEVSGLASADLLMLAREGSQIALRRPSDDPTLSPMGDAALLAGRAVVGSGRLPTNDLVTVQVVVDASASMRPSLESGMLRALLELLSGVAPIIATDSRLHVVVAGPVPYRPQSDSAQVAAEVEQLLIAAPLRTGFLAQMAGAIAPGASITYVVTDTVPADQAEFARSDARYHLALLAPVDCERAIATMCSLPFTVVGTGDASGHKLLADRVEVDRIIRSLLSSLRPTDVVGGPR